MARGRRRSDIARLEAELEEARPFLALAREIKDEARRAAADASAGVEMLEEAVEAIPRRERVAIARAVFDRLQPDEQWAIVERVFDDEDLRAALDAGRRAILDRAQRAAGSTPLIARARAEGRLDTAAVPADERLTLGLFRESDVSAAVERGRLSATCARRLVLRAGAEPGKFHVVEDVFNPEGGYFVTREYDEDTWRTHERLPAHSVVRAGSITDAKGARTFSPIIYLRGRVDFEREGEALEGRLHAGYLMLGDEDVFSSGRSAP